LNAPPREQLRGVKMDTLEPAPTNGMLERMSAAGVTAVNCIRVLSKGGQNLVGEVLRGNGEFTQWEHYPPDDVRDPETHAQYYFHAHAPDGRTDADYGHFHTFMTCAGIPPGISPLEQRAAGAGALLDGPCHLIAISMSREGMPERLFTTNRWVTGGTWYSARDVIAMLDRFEMDIAWPSWPLNQWLSAMLVLFRPQIEQLLLERDRTIEAWQTRFPERDVFEDRSLEITSSLAIALDRQLEWLDRLTTDR
jgi:hypothetical protein